jgi:cytochrome c-type biogenesis protein CcmE
VDLTPRAAPGPATDREVRRRRSPWAYVALAVVIVGLGVVAYQALTSASLYFYNADEAVEQRDDLGTRRFRLQGSVLDEVTRRADDEGVTFTVRYNGVEVPVEHARVPPARVEPRNPRGLGGARAAAGGGVIFDPIHG